MITRKLKRPLDRYITAVEEGSDFANRRAQFYHTLRAFYRRRWGCNFKAPHVSGVELDLYRLYECVKEFGGWQKVTSGDRWSEVLNALSIPDDDVQVARHAVNTLYMRYLSRFEQSETGNDADGDDSDLHSGRSRLKLLSSFINTESPISIPRGAAQSSSLQQQRSTASNFDKLLKSLLSGLPNEVDFAMNVCTLLSHPGPYSLKLPDAPHSALIQALVAHCGVFADGPNSLEDIHLNAWRKQSEHDFLEFWRQAGIEDKEVLSLLSPQLCISAADRFTEHNVGLFAEEDDKLELKKPANWRVFQVLSLFRNLSFEQANRRPMASNLPLLKFLLCCCNSRWIQLRNAAFDTLSNIASEIDLTSNESILTNNLLLKATSEALHSQDKFKVLRALEILTGLSMSRKNEPIMCAQSQLGPRRLIDRIFALVTAQDVLLCTFTLEYIYWASELGRASCDMICGCSHRMDTLVNFATTDAASFGTMGIAGMKVVEINGLTGHLQPYHPQRVTSNQPPLLTSQLIPRHDSARSPPPTPLVPNSNASSSSTTKQTPPPALVPQIAASEAESTIPPKRNHKEAGGESRLERLTREWIEANCDLRADGTANRGEMYACYAEAIQREHSMMAGSLQMFITKLRISFPSIEISNQPGSSVVEGLVFKGRSSDLGSVKRESSNLAAQHPLMQQILSESSKGDKEPRCSASPSPSSRSPATTNQQDNGELKTEIASPRQDPIKSKGGDQASSAPPSPLLNGVEEGTLNGDMREEHKLRASARIAATKRANGKSRKKEGLNGETTTLCNGGIASTQQPNSDANGTGHAESRKHHSSPAATHASSNPSKRARGSTRTTSSTSSEQEAIVYKAVAPAASALIHDSQHQPVPAFVGPIDPNTPSTSSSTSTGDLMCEWNCCGRMFVSAEAVLYHHTEYHLREEKDAHPVDSGAESDREELFDEVLTPIICRWPSCSTDNTPRSKWSMVTHLQDHHCSEPHLQATMARRLEMGHQHYLAHLKQQLDRNKEAAHHPIGYSKFAATEAIRRHAFSYLAKDVTEDSEGPVTKSLRLTSSLILRNIARYSAEGRRKLQKHEARLAWMAGSRMEASTVLAQTLAELAKHQKQPCTGNFSGIQNVSR